MVDGPGAGAAPSVARLAHPGNRPLSWGPNLRGRDPCSEPGPAR